MVDRAAGRRTTSGRLGMEISCGRRGEVMAMDCLGGEPRVGVGVVPERFNVAGRRSSSLRLGGGTSTAGGDLMGVKVVICGCVCDCGCIVVELELDDKGSGSTGFRLAIMAMG
jgi:hypothetical protein